MCGMALVRAAPDPDWSVGVSLGLSRSVQACTDPDPDVSGLGAAPDPDLGLPRPVLVCLDPDRSVRDTGTDPY